MEYAKRGTAGCKKCKEKIVKGVVRIGKVVPNPFSESAGDMKEWHHVKCIFEKLEKARATTKKIEDITDLEGWEELEDEDKEIINKHVSGTTAVRTPTLAMRRWSASCLITFCMYGLVLKVQCAALFERRWVEGYCSDCSSVEQAVWL